MKKNEAPFFGLGGITTGNWAQESGPQFAIGISITGMRISTLVPQGFP